MAGQGKRTGHRRSYMLHVSAADGTPVIVDGTTKAYFTSPKAGRIVGVSFTCTETLDESPVITIANEDTSASTTVTITEDLAANSVFAETLSNANEIPFDAGAQLSLVSDGDGTQGQGFFTIECADEVG